MAVAGVSVPALWGVFLVVVALLGGHATVIEWTPREVPGWLLVPVGSLVGLGFALHWLEQLKEYRYWLARAIHLPAGGAFLAYFLWTVLRSGER